jgi:CARDB protein
VICPPCSLRDDRSFVCRLLAWALVLSMAILPGPVAADAGVCPNSGVPGTPYEGFGAETPGGSGKPIYRVTTLADSGPGSLRDALSAGNRCIVFDVAGNIVLGKQLYVHGAFVTVDGFAAPSPGITVLDYGVGIWGTHGAHDVILRGVRFRNAGQKSCDDGECWDGIQIKNGAYRIVIDHVSSDHASDGAIDITSQQGTLTRDVTIQWSILSGTRNQAAMGRAARVSMHHNLFIGGQNRNPQADWDTTLATRPPDTVLDFRNNVVWDFSAYGTLVRRNATANILNNYYYSSSRPTAASALTVDYQGRAHAAGNHSGNGADVDARGTERAAFPAPPVATTDACRAAYEVQDEAGARGVTFDLDAVDSRHLAQMPASQLPGCTVVTAIPSPPPPSPAPARPVPSDPPATPIPILGTSPASRPDLVMTSLSIPSTIYSGLEFPIKVGITNRGVAPAGSARLRVYLSRGTTVAASDVLLRARSMPALVPGASQWHAITEVIPPEIEPGSYHVLLIADADAAVNELDERNNVTVAEVTVARPIPTTPTPDLVTTGVLVPSALRRGTGFSVKFDVKNRGTGIAGASRLKIYLSTDAGLSADDVLLRSRSLAALAPGAAQSHALTEVVPPTVRPGSYYLVLVVDDDGAVRELNERNNVTAVAVTVW